MDPNSYTGVLLRHAAKRDAKRRREEKERLRQPRRRDEIEFVSDFERRWRAENPDAPPEAGLPA